MRYHPIQVKKVDCLNDFLHPTHCSVDYNPTACSPELYKAFLPFCRNHTVNFTNCLVPSRTALLIFYRARAAVLQPLKEWNDVLDLMHENLTEESLDFADYGVYESLYQASVNYTKSVYGEEMIVTRDKYPVLQRYVDAAFKEDPIESSVCEILSDDISLRLDRALNIIKDFACMQLSKYIEDYQIDLDRKSVPVNRHLLTYITRYASVPSRRYIIHNYSQFARIFGDPMTELMYSVLCRFSTDMSLKPTTYPLQFSKLEPNRYITLNWLNQIQDLDIQDLLRYCTEAEMVSVRVNDETLTCFYNGKFFHVGSQFQVLTRGKIEIGEMGRSVIKVLDGSEYRTIEVTSYYSEVQTSEIGERRQTLEINPDVNYPAFINTLIDICAASSFQARDRACIEQNTVDESKFLRNLDPEYQEKRTD